MVDGHSQRVSVASSENSSFLPTRDAERRGRLAVDQPGSSFAVLIRVGIHQRHAIGAYRQDFGLSWWMSACPTVRHRGVCQQCLPTVIFTYRFHQNTINRAMCACLGLHTNPIFSRISIPPVLTGSENNKQSMRLQRDCGKVKVSRSHSTLSVKAVSRRSSQHTHPTSFISAARSFSKNPSVDNTTMS